MFRDVLLDRVIFTGVTVFVLVIGAQLYRWHACSTTGVTLIAQNRVAQAVAPRKEPPPVEDAGHPGALAVSEAGQTHLSNADTQTLSETAKAFSDSEISKDFETMEAFLHNGSSIC